MKGYKVFNKDWTCRGFQYEAGKTYRQYGVPVLCESGFHFCFRAVDCFNYYSFNNENKVAEVIAHGEVVTDGDKSCTNVIEIVRELTWYEVLDLVNTGEDCTGRSNSGDLNSGNWNSGDLNSGNGNSGNGNSGNGNSGNGNSGNWNSGDWNSGDWNKASFVAGCFNTDQHDLLFFDKPTKMTYKEWRNSEACQLMNGIEFQPVEWIAPEGMTDEEKNLHPEYDTLGGYLKKNNNPPACKEWWDDLSDREKLVIRTIPNFDAAKFLEITGVDVEA